MTNHSYYTLSDGTKIQIAHGNSKLGANIPNWNISPILSCPRGVPCAKIGQCYVINQFRYYKQMAPAYQRNLHAIRTMLSETFHCINTFLVKYKPRYFRIHSSGDFDSQEYLDAWINCALDHPGTNFLAFTKQYQLDYSQVPGNMKVIFSGWPGYPMPALPDIISGTAWMQDGTEDRVPDNALECPGNCDTCGMCWHIDQAPARAVVFHKH